jgi:hypothetical protein
MPKISEDLENGLIKDVVWEILSKVNRNEREKQLLLDLWRRKIHFKTAPLMQYFFNISENDRIDFF